jgi:hypothetical protein
MTTVTTQNPVRSDLASIETGADDRTTTTGSRLWAAAGIGSALLGAATIVTSSAAGFVYLDKYSHGSVDGIAGELSDNAGVLFAFHSITTLGALLMVVFAAGLFRRLRATAPTNSLAPVVALVGLAGTAVVSVLGSGLDTEFMVPAAQDKLVVDDASAAVYGHWIGTIPWLWTLVGLAGLAVFAVSRSRGVPRWLGIVGLVLGGLTLLMGVSPFEYMSGVTGVLWLLVTALGFTVGDRSFREASRAR